MSGLLPRTTDTQQDGSFTNLTVQNLTVSLVGFVNSLVANTLNIGTFVIDSFTANTATVTTANVTNLNVSDDVSITTTAGQAISMNCTNNAIINNEVAFGKSGVYGGSVGLDLTTNDTYLWSQNALKLGTSATERLRIPSTGIAIDNAATGLLALQGTTLVSKNNVVDTSSTQTLTNKTINTGANTIQVSTAANANINSLIDQDVRSTATPTFTTVNATNQVNVQTTNTSGVLINQALNVAQNTNGLTVQSGGVTKAFFGHNQSLDLCYWSAAPGLRILTGGGERLRIPAAGIANDNTATAILALQGTTLVNKNNVVDTSSAQTLTNKTLTNPVISTISNGGTVTIPSGTDTLVNLASGQTLTNKTINSANNTLQVNGANINTLINQPVLNTSTVSFPIINNTTLNTNLTQLTAPGLVSLNESITYLTNPLYRRFSVVRTLAAGSSGNILLAFTSTTNSSFSILSNLSAVSTVTLNAGGYQFGQVFFNNAGTVTDVGNLVNNKRESNNAGFANDLVISYVIVGPVVNVALANTGVLQINVHGVVEIYQSI